MSTRLPDEMSQLFSIHPAVSESGSLSQSILSPDILHELQRKPLVTSNIHNFTSVSSERLLPPIHQKIFHQELADMLCLTYHKVYPSLSLKLIPLAYMQSSRAVIANHILSSKKSRTMSVVVAYWPAKFVRRYIVWPDSPILAVQHKVLTQQIGTLQTQSGMH